MLARGPSKEYSIAECVYVLNMFFLSGKNICVKQKYQVRLFIVCTAWTLKTDDYDSFICLAGSPLAHSFFLIGGRFCWGRFLSMIELARSKLSLFAVHGYLIFIFQLFPSKFVLTQIFSVNNMNEICSFVILTATEVHAHEGDLFS